MFRIISSIVIFVLVLASFACKDKGTEPSPPIEPRDYVVFIASANLTDTISAESILGYHPFSNYLDTIGTSTLSVEKGFAVSADGKLLFLSSDAGTAVLTTDSLQIVKVFPAQGTEGAGVSPDGDYVVLLGHGWDVLRYPSLEIVHHDTDYIHSISFSPSGDRFAAIAQNGNGGWYNLITRMNASFRSERIHTFSPIGTFITLVKDTSVWLTVTHGQGSSLFTVYDPLLYTVHYSRVFVPGSVRILATADGQQVFISNPGNWLTPLGPPWLYSFSTRTNRLDSIATNIVNDSNYGSFAVGQMAMTPDERFLVAVDAFPNGYIVVVDVVLGRAVAISQAKWNYLLYPTCQYRL